MSRSRQTNSSGIAAEVPRPVSSRAASTSPVKFATYWHDQGGLQYAQNCYYSATYGRFTTPDPYRASGGPSDPGSWNRYAYVEGDPINFNDPRGLAACPVDSANSVWVCDTGGPGGAGGAGSNDMQDDSAAQIINGEAGGSSVAVVDGLTFRDWGNSGPYQALIIRRLEYIRSSIDPDCSKWLLANTVYADIGDYIDTLLENHLIGHASVVESDSRYVNNANTGSGVGGFAIVINVSGSFFNKNAPRSAELGYDREVRAINPASERSGVFTLLHEFAHSLSSPGFREDRRERSNGLLNNDDVWSNCRNTLKGATNQ